MTKILNEINQRGAFFSPPGKGKDEFNFKTLPDEVFHSCRLTILETHLGADAQIASAPSLGDSGDLTTSVEWNCTGSGMVKYQMEAFTFPALELGSAASGSVARQMTDFLPSANGFNFDNQFEQVQPYKLMGNYRWGDASKGLCGGMVYAALDYFSAGLEIPTIPKEDSSATFGSPIRGPVFDHIGKRLFSSFDVPMGVWNYVELMNPKFPNFRKRNSRLGIEPESRAWRMVRQEWPIIKRKLDTGQPCPLGLIRIISNDITRLGEHHQVLAYGYDLVENDLTLFIYDPNYHHDDHIKLILNIANPEQVIPVSYSDGKDVFCFFATNYTFTMPPGKGTIPGRTILFEDENFCGKSIDVIHANPDLRAFKEGNFDDRTSSLVILSGKWSFYRKPDFTEPFMRGKEPLVLSQGSYEKVADIGIGDNQITSLKEIEQRGDN